MNRIIWPSQTATHAEAWRVLDLCGLTNNPRQSMNFVRARYLYVNGNPISSLRETVEIGKKLRFELRFPNDVVAGMTLMLVRPTHYKPRINQPDTTYRKP